MSKTEGVAVAAGASWPRRHRRLTAGRIARGSVPYALILPVIAAIGAILGYPLYNLVRLSFQHYTLFELIKHHGQSVGLKNFSSVLHDAVFWHTVLRTVVFTIANVGLTMVIGTSIALLLVRLAGWARILLTSGLVLVWATPVVVAAQVWIWMTNYQNGIVNYVLTKLHVGQLLAARLVRDDLLAAQPDHDVDRLGRRAVRRDQRLRSARAGARGARRGR